jgi:hypothetical protein
MNEPESTSALAVRLWRRMPFAFAIAVALGSLGVATVLTSLGLWDASDATSRYIGAASGGLVAYWMAADWRRDARAEYPPVTEAAAPPGRRSAHTHPDPQSRRSSPPARD